MGTEQEFDMDGALDSITDELGLTGDAPSEDAPLGDDAPPPETPVVAAATPTPASPSPELPPAPKSWRKEAQEVWAQLPDQARSEVLKREEDMLRGIEEYKGKGAFGERMMTAVQPFQQYFQQTGVPPEQMFANLMSAHMFLSHGPAERKAEVFQRLARDYGIDLQALAGQPAQPGQPAAQPDPQVAELRQAVMSLGSQLQGMTKAQHDAAFQENLRLVTEFSQSPDHPHFEEVAEDISRLLQTRVAANLQEAYDKAIWQNPATREKVIAKITADAEAKRQQEAKDRAAAARRATAANVATRDRAGKPTASLGSIDDTLAETLTEIKSRAA